MRKPLGALASTVLIAATATVVVLPQGHASAAAKPLTCGGKKVTIVGTPGNDIIRGTNKADVIHGLGGADVINGFGGNDIICGGFGADDLRGNGGNDRLYGQQDAYYWNQAATWWRVGDILRGGPGNDVLVPGIDHRHGFGPDILDVDDTISYDTAHGPVRINLVTQVGQEVGGYGVDRVVVNGRVRLIGTRWNDHFVGSPFRDTIFAQGGDDVVDDGPGASSVDLYYGGEGNDCLRYAEADPTGGDVVAEFEQIVHGTAGCPA